MDKSSKAKSQQSGTGARSVHRFFVVVESNKDLGDCNITDLRDALAASFFQETKANIKKVVYVEAERIKE